MAIKTCETSTRSRFFGSGALAVPCSSLRSADARASGSPVSLAPSSSASYSRVREIASWTTMAATGASRAIASAASGLPPRSRLPPKISRNCASDVMTPAIALATEDVRMSRLYTCMSSWPRTPRSSRSSSSVRIPSVQHTAAFLGLRPVANALGACVGETYSLGMG
ncbi:hypothetical protein D3C74_342120 [compost metagenome]